MPYGCITSQDHWKLAELANTVFNTVLKQR